MNPRWITLRTDWQGSVNDAFEALVCQIAGADETVPSGSRFFRVKAPDAAMECYWVMPTGDEWGWRSKFFSSMGTLQWDQLTNSFRTALAKHPKLVKFIVALPNSAALLISNRLKRSLFYWTYVSTTFPAGAA
jgi:hypothetical protein